MSTDVKLGTAPNDTHGRDAVHIAVVPVTSADGLMPGQHVGIVAGSSDRVSARPPFVGIVDPFRPRDTIIAGGEPFWLCLYPQSITSLRHNWTHPAFEAQPAKELTEKEKSEEWLRNFAASCGASYDRMMGAIEDDDFINMGENEDYKNVAGWDQLDKHASIVLGKEIKGAYPFSCSC